MKKASFNEALSHILREDPRYPADAYYFVREALDFTSKMLKKPSKGPQKHVTAVELLEGIRQYALREYGPMALTILNYWGIQKCSDFGRIVFNLVNKHILRKRESDSVHDFDAGYDFETAFRRPYQAACKCRPSGFTARCAGGAEDAGKDGLKCSEKT